MRGAAEVLGPQFLFVAQRIQVIDLLPKDDVSAKLQKINLWKAKYQDRDPTWGQSGDGMRSKLLLQQFRRQNKQTNKSTRCGIETIRYKDFPGCKW